MISRLLDNLTPFSVGGRHCYIMPFCSSRLLHRLMQWFASISASQLAEDHLQLESWFPQVSHLVLLITHLGLCTVSPAFPLGVSKSWTVVGVSSHLNSGHNHSFAGAQLLMQTKTRELAQDSPWFCRRTWIMPFRETKPILIKCIFVCTFMCTYITCIWLYIYIFISLLLFSLSALLYMLCPCVPVCVSIFGHNK